MFKILLIGPGLIGKKHAQLIYDHPKLKLEAIVAPHKDRYKNLEEKYDTTIYSDLESALSHKKFDAVVISSPNEVHFDQTVLCLEHNLPTLVEKPLTSNLNDAKTLVDLAESKNIPLLVADHRLYNPLLYTTKQFINSNKFGKIVSFWGSAQFYKPKHYFETGLWRTKLGGGPILINLIHEIGIMRVLCGEIKRLSAIASNQIRKFEVEDTVAINLEFENGALGTFILSDTAVSNKSWEMTTGENPAYPSHPNDMSYHIAGTKASLDFPNMKIRRYNDQETASWWEPFCNETLAVKKENPLAIQIDHFSKILSNNITPISSAKNGYINMLVIEAIKKSINEKRFVHIDTSNFKINIE